MDWRMQNQTLFLIHEMVFHSSFFMFLIVLAYHAQCVDESRSRHRRLVRYSMIGRIPKNIEKLERLVCEEDIDCFNNLRLNKTLFLKLCDLLTEFGGLRDYKYVSVSEQLAMFLKVVAHHTKNRIVGTSYVENDVWEKYVKVYPSVKNMRRKSWCFYEDWCLIFGKDRANGEHVAGFEEVVSEHAGTHEPIYPFSMGSANPSPDKGDEVTSNSPGVGAETNSPGVGTEINSPEVGTKTTGPSHSNQTNKGKKKTRGTKRTAIEAGVQSEKVVGIMEQYLEHYKEFSNDLASKIATPSTAQDVVAEKTGKIVDIMEEMQEIPHVERVYLTFKIANSPTHADVFLKMSPISRSFFIQGMRSGSL